MKNIFYDKSKIDYGNLLFPRRALWMLLIPLIIEQMLNSLMGMVDTLMVSRVGAEAISAVSLVDSINNLVLQVFAAMAAGAAIICSQYLGRKDEKGCNDAAKQDCAYCSSDFICYYDYWRWLSKAAASFDIRKCRRSCYD